MRLIPQPSKITEKEGVCVLSEITVYETSSDMKNPEGYELIISPDKVVARASNEKGFYYANVTFSQLKKLYTAIPCAVIIDSPRYSYRGFMIDCARHMFSVDELKKMISAAADVKFNKFHWHLFEDQGLRVELDSFPELTKKGSVRKCDSFRHLCKSDKEYSGYYTKDEIREIISFCAERYIDVIPEFDMPGHMSAFLHVFPEFTCKGTPVEVKTKNGIFKDVLCIGNTSSREVLYDVLNELCELFPYEEFHIGGDEVPRNNWEKCDKCQSYIKKHNLKNEDELQGHFMNEIADFLKKKGKKPIVWNNCLKGENVDSSLTVQHWMGSADKTVKAANSGQKLIFSPFTPYYVDYPYGMHPLKDVYKYEPENFKGLSQKGKDSIIGVESPIWTEYISDNERLEYMCFPRWFAVAESAWTLPQNKEYNDFFAVLEILCDIYRNNGLNIPDKNEWNVSFGKRIVQIFKFFCV